MRVCWTRSASMNRSLPAMTSRPPADAPSKDGSPTGTDAGTGAASEDSTAEPARAAVPSPVGLRRFVLDTEPLSIPAYRRLWTSTIVTAVGSQLTAVAVPKQIYDVTG